MGIISFGVVLVFKDASVPEFAVVTVFALVWAFGGVLSLLETGLPFEVSPGGRMMPVVTEGMIVLAMGFVLEPSGSAVVCVKLPPSWPVRV